eukprot:150463_1
MAEQLVAKMKVHHENEVIKEEQTIAHVLSFMEDYFTSPTLEYYVKKDEVETHPKFYLYPSAKVEQLPMLKRLEVMILANAKRAGVRKGKRAYCNDLYWNSEGNSGREAQLGARKKRRTCKDCNENRGRIIHAQSKVNTVCWICLKKYLLSLITDPSKSYLTVKDKGDGAVCIGNPMFGVGNSKHSKRPFYFVNISTTKSCPDKLPVICMLAYNGAFDKE